MADPILAPRSVAVVGASKHPTKLGHVIARNIVSGKFRGRVEFVNPSGGRLFGRTLHRSVADIPRPVDLAVLAVPAPAVSGVVGGGGGAGGGDGRME
jgi:acetyltransferase